MIETSKYVRKPFTVEGIQVSEENLEQVADWCGGHVRTQTTMSDGAKRYVKVNVREPKTNRQTKAYVGDWILLSDGGYKVYTQSAFEKSFQPEEAPNV